MCCAFGVYGVCPPRLKVAFELVEAGEAAAEAQGRNLAAEGEGGDDDDDESWPGPIVVPDSAGRNGSWLVTEDKLNHYVGKPRFNRDVLYDQLMPGVVIGLAWTSMGGAVLFIETVVSRRRESDYLSGSGGDGASVGGGSTEGVLKATGQVPTWQPGNLPTYQPTNLPTYQPGKLLTDQPVHPFYTIYVGYYCQLVG
jgi:hypothetical protein